MKKMLHLFILLYSGILSAENHPPRLILQLVVDQLRGDLIQQYQEKFGADGFNYLLNHGVNYQNAHHSHANTVTCAGHATIATGAYPSLHGMISNQWYDRNSRKEIYCVEDANSKILPTPRTKTALPGRSPWNLMASTLSDELVLAQKGRAFGVAFKDRAAITLAGHAGKAFWFDTENGGFVTSQHYYGKYPHWVNDWNTQFKPEAQSWNLSNVRTSYKFVNAPGFKNHYPSFGQGFPHKTGKPEHPDYYKLLSMTPVADELTAEFATLLLSREQLGISPQKTDYLAVSFATLDVVGHQFGPNSMESEDTLLRLDKTLAKLLKKIDQQVGLQNTLIVLTADHGASDSFSYLSSHHIKEQASIDKSLLRKTITNTLAKRFRLPANTLQAINLPWIYLDHQIITGRNLGIVQVSSTLVEILRQQPGVFQAYTLPMDSVERDWLSAKVDKMSFSKTAGDIYLVPTPWQINNKHSSLRISHNSPWQYDSFVPLLFVNSRFKNQTVSRPVSTTDIAATLAALLLVKPPSAAVGQPLAEVMAFFNKLPEKDLQ